MKIAERFAEDNGGVTTVIIASGETEVDAVTAAGLAGNMDAVVLLSRSSRLPHNVARFIDEHNVTNVIVVGGTASVSDDVLTAIKSLGSDPDVGRVSGADRYETAAKIGNRLGGPNPTWCGSDQNAAILVNGGSEGRADAVAIGPLAYALGLPVLLTTSEELPQATEDFLVDNKVERVVIVGGMSAVSEGIKDSLVEDVGVVTTQRISGGTAAGTSVDIAKEMLGDCADVLNTNKDKVALVNRDAIADGITAAPLLGRGLGGGNPMPILLVSDELPAAVSDYLASTKNERNNRKTHLSILAIGGTAVVSGGITDTAKGVMDAAIAAAKTSGDITADIEAKKYTVADAVAGSIPEGKKIGDYKNVFVVTFSDPVDDDSVADPTLYRINGRRLEALDDFGDDGITPTPGNEESLLANNYIDVANGIVTVTLNKPLKADDEITVVGGDQVARAKNGDLRRLKEKVETLDPVTTAVDRAAPRVEIIAVAGEPQFDVIVHEDNILYNELSVATNLGNFISVRGVSIPRSVDDADTPGNTSDDTVTERLDRAVTVAFVGDTDPVTTNDTTAVANDGRWPDSGVVRMRFSVDVTAKATSPNQGDPENELLVGDVITVHRNAVRDDDGRSNALTQRSVQKLKAATKFEIASVSIGSVQHGWLDGSGHAMATIDGAMSVTAKADGGAAGAQGNGWKIYGYDDRPGQVENVFEWDIRVGVDVANKTISYTIFQKPAVPGFEKRAAVEPTIGALADKLVADDDFAAHFKLAYLTPRPEDGRAHSLGATAPAGVAFGATAATQGVSSVGVIVRFNDTVRSLVAANQTTLAADLTRGSTGSFVVQTTLVAEDAVYDNQVHQTFYARSMLALPKRSGFRVITADLALSYGDSDPDTAGRQDLGNIREILSSLRPDASIRPRPAGTIETTAIEALVPTS